MLSVDRHRDFAMNAYTIAEAKNQLSRLVDEALAGDLVMITRDGKPVVTLLPAAAPARAAPKPMTPEEVDEMRRKAELRPRLTKDWVAVIREMRDEDP